MASQKRVHVHPVFDYFIYNEGTNKSNCQSEGCSFPVMNGKHTSTLEAHIKCRHKETFAELIEKKRKLSSSKRQIHKTQNKDTVINVKISRKAFISGCLQCVILNGRPFSMFQDDGFQLIVSPIMREFERVNEPVPISANYIQNIAKHVQMYVVDKIKSEIKGKLLSLQLDLTNHFQRCILGINVQYYVQNQLVLRVLAMRRMNVGTSALNISNEVRKVLEDYGADVDHIYTLTTDNGPNVILCTQILQLMQERSLETHLWNHNFGDNINEEELRELIEIESGRILQDQAMHFLHIVRCSAHTLQLSIGDALDTQPSNRIIENCRTVVKKLRAPTIVNLLNSRKLKLAKIDIDIRWSSVYDMVGLLC